MVVLKLWSWSKKWSILNKNSVDGGYLGSLAMKLTRQTIDGTNNRPRATKQGRVKCWSLYRSSGPNTEAIPKKGGYKKKSWNWH